MTELEKLLAGELYDYSDPEIEQLHGKAYYLGWENYCSNLYHGKNQPVHIMKLEKE